MSNNKNYFLRAITITIIFSIYSYFPAEAKQIHTQRQAEILYMLKHDCGSCHGMSLQGGLGPALLPINLHNKSLSYIQSIILSGKPGTPMPPWSPFLTKDEINWLAKTLKSGLLTKAKLK